MHGLMFGGFKVSSFYMGRDNTPDWYRSAGNHRIATHLRKQGWDIECLDYVWAFEYEELIEYIDKRVTKETVFMGVSIIFFPEMHHIDKMQRVFKYVRKKYPWVKVIAGGVKSYAITSIKADYYIAGNGETAIEVLLKYLMGRGSEPTFNTVEKTGTKIIDGYNVYPCYPKRDAAISYEERDFIKPYETLNIELGRGCRFKCKYCTFPLLGLKGNMMRDEDSVYEELKENYDRWGVHSYYITDDTVNDSKEKMKMVGDAARRLDFQPQLNGYARADLLISHGKETWDDMIAAGFTSHSYGIESFNHESAKVMGKGMHPDKMKEGILEIEDYFVERSPYFYTGSLTMICGLPHETFETLDETKDWLNKYWRNHTVGYLPLYLQYGEEDDEIDKIDENITTDFVKMGYTFEENPIVLNKRLKETFDGVAEGRRYNENKEVNFNFWIHPSGDYGWVDAIEWVRDFTNERINVEKCLSTYCFEGAAAWMTEFNSKENLKDYYVADSKVGDRELQWRFVQEYRKDKLSYK